LSWLRSRSANKKPTIYFAAALALSEAEVPDRVQRDPVVFPEIRSKLSGVEKRGPGA
jgi:hypothetical protein